LFTAEPRLPAAFASEVAGGRPDATAAFDHPFAAVTRRAAVAPVMTRSIVQIAGLGPRGKAQLIANDSGWIGCHGHLR